MEPDLQRGISPMVGPAASQPGGRGFDSRPAQVRLGGVWTLFRTFFGHFFGHFLAFSDIFWTLFRTFFGHFRTFFGHVGDRLGSVLGCFWDGFRTVLGDTFRTHFGRNKKFSESAGSNFPGCIDGKLSLPGLSPDKRNSKNKWHFFVDFPIYTNSRSTAQRPLC